MKRYKLFVATYTYMIQSMSASEEQFMVLALNLDGDAPLYKWESTHKTLESAQERAKEVDDDTMRIIKMPKPLQTTYKSSLAFDNRPAAVRWLNSQVESRGHDVHSINVDEVIIEEDELEEYLYQPTYTVEAYVSLVKRITIDVDTAEEEYEDCEDAFDVEQIVRNKINNGDWDYEIEDAEVWDTEINDVEVIED